MTEKIKLSLVALITQTVVCTALLLFGTCNIAEVIWWIVIAIFSLVTFIISETKLKQNNEVSVDSQPPEPVFYPYSPEPPPLMTPQERAAFIMKHTSKNNDKIDIIKIR